MAIKDVTLKDLDRRLDYIERGIDALATKDDLASTEERLRGDMASMEGRIKTELRGDMASMEGRLLAEIRKGRNE